jgi:hypothetical protein
VRALKLEHTAQQEAALHLGTLFQLHRFLAATNPNCKEKTPWPESASEPYRPSLVGEDNVNFCG